MQSETSNNPLKSFMELSRDRQSLDLCENRLLQYTII